MYLRRKLNASGSTSVQVVQKQNGRVKIVQTIGSSKNALEIAALYELGLSAIKDLQQLSELPFDQRLEQQFVDDFKRGIQQLCLVGPELLLGQIFDDIGFNAIEQDLFRHLVITRLVYPVSKLKTVDYLAKYKGIQTSVYSIYRYLDKLQKHQLEQVKQISLTHTLQLFGTDMSIVFYDVTTLYFEAKEEDDFKRMGFSKDGKHQQPQIVLGLLVSKDGYPLDYDVFEGDKYEGDTLIPIIEHFVNKHQPQQLIVVADAGLLSQKNIVALSEKKYQYILGARIKNESQGITKQILALQLQDGQSAVIDKGDGSTLIVGYKKSRAINDHQNRQRGLEKLEKKIKTGKLTKQHINNKGYNKYLKIEGKATIGIDHQKYVDDQKWDGLKGYRTNTCLSKEAVIEQYHQLWQIEKTFRISKHDLQIRPVYHQLKRRIEAHVCIAFAACKIYKELERLLKEKKANKSAQEVIDILKTILMVQFTTPFSKKVYQELIVNNKEQKDLVALFNLTL
jgi:transposase